jgi:plasmid stability protein
MISAQVACDEAEALDLLKVRAATSGQSVEHTALDVLDGVVRFDDPASG